MKNSSLVFVITLFLSLPLWAESSPSNLGEQADSSLDALKKANQYSFDTGGIGVLIAYGNGNGVSAQAVGKSFVEEIQRRGMNARYFFYNADWPGMTVEYHIGYSALGPWSANDAAGQVSKAVARANAAQRIHGR